MKRVLVCAILAAAMITIGYAQARDPFSGSWKINRAKSKQQVGAPPLSEDITIRVEDGVEHYTVDVKNPDGTGSKNGYDAKYNDGQWHPYVNRTTGETTSQVMMVKVDPRTEYRFMKNKDGKSTGVLMRKMADDERSYASIMMTTAGEISLVRVFERQDTPTR
jgi:hypothetical protein